MRLFIAINFTDEIKDSLCDIMQGLRQYAKQGNFTNRQNLHLTLVFIGETMNISIVKQAMDKVNTGCFTLYMGGIGKFRRDGGDIYWIGVDKSSELSGIYNQLCTELLSSGFIIEKREFKPHLTLSREVILENSFNKDDFAKTIQPMSMDVLKISLMKSERINGKMNYTEIYAKELG